MSADIGPSQIYRIVRYENITKGVAKIKFRSGYSSHLSYETRTVGQTRTGSRIKTSLFRNESIQLAGLLILLKQGFGNMSVCVHDALNNSTAAEGFGGVM